MNKSKNWDVLKDFIAYCVDHPDERFWQALLNWSGKNFILFSTISPTDSVYKEGVLVDPYYFTGKDN